MIIKYARLCILFLVFGVIHGVVAQSDSTGNNKNQKIAVSDSSTKTDTGTEGDLLGDDDGVLILEDDSEEDILVDGDDEDIISDLSDEQTNKDSVSNKTIDNKNSIHSREDYLNKRYEDYKEYNQTRYDFLNQSTSNDDTVKKQVKLIAPTQASVESVQTINFAKNIEEYRSPIGALFLSLFIPGAGQAYAKSYWQSAIFGLAEVAIAGVTVHYAVSARRKKRDAESFADNNFSSDNFWKYYENLQTYFTSTGDTTIFGELDTISFSSKSNLNIKNEDYYNTIKENQFVQGWNDCEPKLGADGFESDTGYKYTYSPVNIPTEDSYGDTIWLVNQFNANGDTVSKKIYGYSQKQNTYNDMVSEYNHNYRISSQNLPFLLLANHLISAVDALITAEVHNRKMLGKQTFLEHINLDQQMVLTETGIKSSFSVRFKF